MNHPQTVKEVVKRLFDLLLASLFATVLLVPAFLIALAVKATSSGPILYWSDRVGKDNKIFKMPKFRSMLMDTPVVATHLLTNPAAHLTPIGHFLRVTSLDELPQLWCIIRGEMSFVGPRPALFNQIDLIDLRTQSGIHRLLPGLTGWAQVNGRDELDAAEKVKFDRFYLDNQTFLFDFKILLRTVLKVISRDGVTH
jgi:O-antigen biosynthesis protein WbqP